MKVVTDDYVKSLLMKYVDSREEYGFASAAIDELQGVSSLKAILAGTSVSSLIHLAVFQNMDLKAAGLCFAASVAGVGIAYAAIGLDVLKQRHATSKSFEHLAAVIIRSGNVSLNAPVDSGTSFRIKRALDGTEFTLDESESIPVLKRSSGPRP
jgi:hypothetical protein